MKQKKFYFTALGFSTLLLYTYAASMIYGFDLAFSASSSPMWKFFISFLGHEQWPHLLTNLSFIAIFGSALEKMTNGKVFLAVFGSSALFANLSSYLFFADSFLIGASGGASGIFAALTLVNPKESVFSPGFSVPMWAMLSIYTLANIVGLGSSTSVAYETHLFGVAAGIGAGIWLRYRKN